MNWWLTLFILPKIPYANDITNMSWKVMTWRFHHLHLWYVLNYLVSNTEHTWINSYVECSFKQTMWPFFFSSPPSLLDFENYLSISKLRCLLFFFLLINRAFLATLLYEYFHFYEDFPFFICLFYSSSYKLQSHRSFTSPLEILWVIISGLWRGSWRCLQLLRIFSFLPQNLLQCIYILIYLCLYFCVRCTQFSYMKAWVT